MCLFNGVKQLWNYNNLTWERDYFRSADNYEYKQKLSRLGLEARTTNVTSRWLPVLFIFHEAKNIHTGTSLRQKLRTHFFRKACLFNEVKMKCMEDMTGWRRKIGMSRTYLRTGAVCYKTRLKIKYNGILALSKLISFVTSKHYQN